MAMTLLEQATFRRGATNLWMRVEEAILNAATAILTTEAGNVANHGARVTWATFVLAAPDNPTVMMNRMRNAVSQVALIANNGEAATDLNVKNAVEGLIDSFATKM